MMEEANTVNTADTQTPLVKSKSKTKFGSRSTSGAGRSTGGGGAHPREPPADLPAVVRSLGQCRRADGTLATDHYLAAINQLVRLFQQLGKGLGLALQGIEKSIKAMEILRVSGTGCHYRTFDLLLQHEKSLGIHERKDRKSGTHHALRLCHYMSFMLEFLTRTEEALDRDEPYRGIARIATYQNTLGRSSYHPPWVQAAIKVMLLKSPGRHEVLRVLGEAARGESSPREVLRDILSKAHPVHETLTKLLSQTLNI